MKQQLKPCPFCGEREDISIRSGFWRNSRYWFVECLPCDATTGKNFDSDADRWYSKFSGKEMAIIHWNRRKK